MEAGRIGGLEINPDHEQRKFWFVERIGWFVTAAIALAALLGLFGRSPANEVAATPAHNGQVRLDFNHEGQFNRATQITVHLSGGSAPDGLARIWVDAAYLQHVQLKQVTPQPAAVEAAPDRLIYVFRITRPREPASFRFEFVPLDVGSISGAIGIVSGQAANFEQFIYP